MRQVHPLPSSTQLASTLAQRVVQLRDLRNLTVRDLARLCRFSLQRIHEIEEGMETWLSSSDRQLLAKALSVEPALLEEVETRVIVSDEQEILNRSQRLAQEVLEGYRDLYCPVCSTLLRCSVQEGLDFEGNPIALPKAFCTQCPFVLR